MVNLQQLPVSVNHLGGVLEPSDLESSLMMIDFSLASLSPSKCHFRDISSACHYRTGKSTSVFVTKLQESAPQADSIKTEVLEGKYN
jgi:hypothetical protein